MTDDEKRLDAEAFLTHVISDAIERHVQHKGVYQFARPMFANYIDTDVHLRPWGLVMHKGSYYHLIPEEGVFDSQSQAEEADYIYTVTVDKEKLNEQMARAESEGRVVVTEKDGATMREVVGDFEVGMQVRRVQASDDRPITFTEAMVWLAIQDAEREGDDEKAQRILAVGYGVKPAKEKGGGGLLPLTALPPVKDYYPLSKEHSYLTSPHAFRDGGIKLMVDKKGKVSINFALMALESPEKLKTTDGKSFQFDHVDQEILCAVINLREAARHRTSEPVVSSYEIARAMGYDQPTPKIRADLEDRLERMMSVGTYLDFTDEAKMRKLDPGTGTAVSGERGKFVVRGPLVPVTAIEATDANGKKVVQYILTDDPPTYKHAKAIHQVGESAHRLRLLPFIDERGNDMHLRNTEQRVGIKHYLIERVTVLNRKNSTISDVVLYDTLCEYLGANASNRTTRKRVMDTAEAYLRSLEREGAIVGFKTITEGRPPTKRGVKILVKERCRA